MTHTTRTALEPIAAPVMAIALAHVLLGMLLWIFLPLWKSGHPTHPENALLDWKTPQDFLLGRQAPPTQPAAQAQTQSPPPAKPKPKAKATAPALPLAKAPVPQPAPVATAAPAPTPVAPAPPSPKPASPPPKPAADPTATIMAAPPQSAEGQHPANKYITLSSLRGDDDAGMGDVDEAIQKAFMQEWIAPAIQQVPANKRSAALNVTIGRDGTVLEAKISKSADGAALDASIREAAEHVKKIPLSLPASYPKERYDLQVNFLIE